MTDIMPQVKQILLRVPDDVHQRLAERAAAEQRSVNSLATELLDRAVDLGAGVSERSRIVAKARRLGLLADVAEAQAVPVEECGPTRATAIEASRGTGPVLDRLLDEGR